MIDLGLERGKIPVHSRIAYVVPTKDRPDDLRKLFESLRKQEDAPDQVIIVDASEPPVKTICDEYADLPLSYVREYPPSLARQRNAGMAALEESITIAGYLDDDLELEPDATGNMRAFWNAAGADIGGAAFTIVNQPVRGSAFGAVADFFLLNAKRQGQLLRSGFASSIAVPLKNTETDWLYGGATLWRRSVIEQHRYDEWYIGHGYLEDVDYSYRVSRKHRLWVVADAHVWHWPRPVMASRQFTLGVQQVVNRIYFTRKIGTFSALALSWALFGQCVFNIAQSLQQRESSGFRRFLGNLKGFTLIMGSKLNSVDGIWK
jgi:GT2 family glycosyltransferase